MLDGLDSRVSCNITTDYIIIVYDHSPVYSVSIYSVCIYITKSEQSYTSLKLTCIPTRFEDVIK